uniref:Uncharacterized protein n=1 Tax=Rhodosorus marinus TaxID=101924 RepID=A0A7S3EHN9_9RHOD|mmetsp:Transcript_37123/g.148126  ORF Transcript_37123/g.148126 Transcript_37123/m.148126 type:complete len:339 (+) Transcript_37123:113-1129(+)
MLRSLAGCLLRRRQAGMGLRRRVNFSCRQNQWALYAGSKRNLTELPVDDLSPKQAFLAPIVSGVFLAGMYFLLRYTSIDVGQIFKYGSVVFGGICLKETLDPIFFNLYTKVFPLQPVTKAVGEDGCEEDVEPWNSPKNVTTALISAAISGSYLLGSGAITFMASNLIGFGLAVRCISLLKPKSLWSAAALLSGLLLYDVFFVFGTDVMVSVATSIEAPAKFLFPRETVPGATGVQSYPFAILGLGDVVVPGIFVAMMAFVDKELVFEDDREVCQVRNGPYFSSSMVAYVAGLFTCFVVNAVSHSPQPALLYLVSIAKLVEESFEQLLRQLLCSDVSCF